MLQLKNAMEIFKILEKSNCRECGEQTCLAFAGSVYQGKKPLDRCPHLSAEILEQCQTNEINNREEGGAQLTEGLKNQLVDLDFEEAAKKSGGKYVNQNIVLKILGREFAITPDGRFQTHLHVKPWVTGPILDYVINGQGVDPTDEWLAFRELDGADGLMHGFFRKRCESTLQTVADNYPDLFDDLAVIFGGKEVEERDDADIAVVIYPLPKMPLMICYMKAEDGMPSTLNILFDTCVDKNVSMDSILTICNGFAAMVEKITEKHGVITVC